MSRIWLSVVLGLSIQAAAEATCTAGDETGEWILRGEGRGTYGEICAASARVIFTGGGQVRVPKLHASCGANVVAPVAAAGTYEFFPDNCLGRLTITDSLGYTVPFFQFILLKGPDELLALHQNRRQKVIYRWTGRRL